MGCLYADVPEIILGRKQKLHAFISMLSSASGKSS